MMVTVLVSALHLLGSVAAVTYAKPGFGICQNVSGVGVNATLDVDNREGEVSVVELGASLVALSHGQLIADKRRLRIDADSALHVDLYRHSRNNTRLKTDDKDGVATGVDVQCHLLPGTSIGSAAIKMIARVSNAGACCQLCGAVARCRAFTYHGSAPTISPSKRETCWLKANEHGQKLTDNATVSGCRGACQPQPPPQPSPPPPAPPLPPSPPQWACAAGFDHFPFCNASLTINQRVIDLISRINDSSKPNLLTARGGPHGMQSFPELGVPAHYWGTNAIHGIDNGACTSHGHCPTEFPSGPNVAATFNRGLMEAMAAAMGGEMRALYNLGLVKGLSIWGPVIDLVRVLPTAASMLRVVSLTDLCTCRFRTAA